MVFFQKIQFNFALPFQNLDSAFEKCTIFNYYFVHLPYFSATILNKRAGQLFLLTRDDFEKLKKNLFLHENDISYSRMLLCVMKILRLFSF